ncbi:MAG: hypothetical protein AB7P34_16560 [Vicinamibacterales bacterium]
MIHLFKFANRNFLLALLVLLGLFGHKAAAQAQSTASREGIPTLSGYMETHLNKVQDQPTSIDLHRFVLMVGHSFSDRLKFWSEVEVEHAFVEGGEETGEVAVEQAYIDLMINRRLNVRAGMVLVPVGIQNERHEPPTFNGVERTFVDSVIVPTTWRDTGAGLFGELGGGVSYRAYVLPGLNAAGFTAEEGIKDGRQQGGRADISEPAVAGRLEWRRGGLTSGASFWRGGSGFGLIRLDIETPTVGVSSLDARYRRGRHELRGQWSMVNIDGAGDLNRALQAQSGISPNIASRLIGAYAEAATRVSPNAWAHEVVVFGRYELFDTQNKMPEGYLPLQEFQRNALVVGATYYPDPDVAFKFDVVRERNKSSVVQGPWHLNVGVGWWF